MNAWADRFSPVWINPFFLFVFASRGLNAGLPVSRRGPRPESKQNNQFFKQAFENMSRDGVEVESRRWRCSSVLVVAGIPCCHDERVDDGISAPQLLWLVLLNRISYQIALVRNSWVFPCKLVSYCLSKKEIDLWKGWRNPGVSFLVFCCINCTKRADQMIHWVKSLLGLLLKV